MQFRNLLLLAVAAVPALATPVKRSGQQAFKFPLSNGFPNPSPSALAAIEKQAHGTLPNGALPTSFNKSSAAVWSLIAFNEIFEVAYFTSLVNNITSGVSGYESADKELLNTLTAIIAQEELHALGANAVLKTAGYPTIAPCEYVFPVDNLNDALAFATTFTDLVLGTLQTALTAFGLDQDTEFLGLVGGVIGQEGEQVGYLRSGAGKIASALPFLTVGGPVWANSALNQLVVVPGSCPSTLPIPVLKPLKVSKITEAKTQTITFTYPGSEYKGYSLSYINQQNKPLVYPITNAKVSGGFVTFDTTFQYADNLLNGLTIASIVKGVGPMTPTEVQTNAIAGPALIELN
ncbi:MAG: hypothetical protein GOMPHAMPRED_002095 [Gomphillus americanus]|uniref:Sexual development protein n=1 Tax=Gomphillus americanus TaxID=1940652 RepID=A0A8H3IMF0_9LECA|nr:MAG: hypothetical protein GOMPHAMPRED_002095 [Gomphillus americanus]